MLTLMTETAVRHTMDTGARAGRRAVQATALRLSFEAVLGFVLPYMRAATGMQHLVKCHAPAPAWGKKTIHMISEPYQLPGTVVLVCSSREETGYY